MDGEISLVSGTSVFRDGHSCQSEHRDGKVLISRKGMDVRIRQEAVYGSSYCAVQHQCRWTLIYVQWFRLLCISFNQAGRCLVCLLFGSRLARERPFWQTRRNDPITAKRSTLLCTHTHTDDRRSQSSQVLLLKWYETCKCKEIEEWCSTLTLPPSTSQQTRSQSLPLQTQVCTTPKWRDARHNLI